MANDNKGSNNPGIHFEDVDGQKYICRAPLGGWVHLGKGSFGDVWQVDALYLDPQIVDPVLVSDHAGNHALKILYSKKGGMNELKTLLQLDDPNKCIIQYIAVGTITDGGIPDYRGYQCLLMERCSGMMLTDLIKRNPKHFSPKVIASYTAQLVSGLHYLHERRPTKFVHGDIRPANIMMKDSTGEVLKIVDLDGASQWKHGPRSPEKDIKAMGALTFMSPEMIAWMDFRKGGRKSTKTQQLAPNSSTDIWGLGCVVLVMYRASQGQHLWPDLMGQDRMKVQKAFFRAVYEGNPLTPSIPQDMPDDLKVLASQCLKINGSDRPTAAALLKYADREYFKCADGGIQFYLRQLKVQLAESGGFGVVHQVNAYRVGADFVEQSPRNLALKAFFKTLEQDEMDRITRTLPKLEHRNIVKYLAVGCFEPDGQFTLIMEYCSGGTLTEAAKMGLTVEQQKKYVNQLLCGIHYLHVEVEPHIVHKDLKGKNVVFEDENKTTLKICDVDSCSERLKEAPQTFISRPVGTRGFMSPEMQKCCMNPRVDRGKYPVGMATDIWSLGAVVLEMYCRGRLIMPEYEIPAAGEIFDSNSPSIPAAVALSIEIPVIPEDMEQELKGFVSKCMALGPKDRPTIEQLRNKFCEW
ncbi:putative Mitogen-activated protein kinase kinase kinase 4 [Hypsibius exemplaris]|uniref:Mitogen-activated protein kinase kinase kinase 4 n=1 Tax=Hypsibius exemplaris TaxID=2072580 RepID=A0A9X6NBH9_HYPEX|nr:putative Mitogen-activated protein kinase kinase kinase 4 [Hypsibius exemplaris]